MFVIQGSSRQNGNTETLTHMMIDGIETEQIYLRTANFFFNSLSGVSSKSSMRKTSGFQYFFCCCFSVECTDINA